MIERQHVWLGPEATSFSEPCEACLATRDLASTESNVVQGTLRPGSDVGWMTCRRGHRIVVHRVGRRTLSRA